MSHAEDQSGDRRDFLYYATAGVGAVTVGAAVWPLVNQMNPSADVQAASQMRVDVSGVSEGTQLTVLFLGKPVFIRRRTSKRSKRHAPSIWPNSSTAMRATQISARSRPPMKTGPCRPIRARIPASGWFRSAFAPIWAAFRSAMVPVISVGGSAPAMARITTARAASVADPHPKTFPSLLHRSWMTPRSCSAERGRHRHVWNSPRPLRAEEQR